MIAILLEIAAIAAVASHLTYLRFRVRRRQAHAWNVLTAHLQPGPPSNLSGHDLGQRLHLSAEQGATSEEGWRVINGAHGLWAMYDDARVMLDMANYAARNFANVDQELLESVRKDAVQVRICVLLAFSKNACNQVNESANVNLSRAAEIYAGMMGHMAQLLQANGGALVTGLARTM